MMKTSKAKATMTAKPAVWRELSNLVAVIDDEVAVKVGPEGLHIATVDPCHVALVNIDIPASAFDAYDVPAASGMGLDMDRVKTMVRAAGEDSITLRELPGKSKSLIELSIPSNVWTFHAIDDAGFSEPRIPDLKLPVRFRVPLSFFMDAIRLGECVSDNVTMAHDRGWLSLCFKGDGESSESRIGTEAKGHARSAFPLDYYSNFFRALSGVEEIEVQMGNDYPMIVSGETKHGVRFVYYLAPRVEEK